MNFTKALRYLKKTFGFVFRTLLAVVVIRYFIMSPGRVNGVSMDPTFTDNQAFIVNKIPFMVHAPKRFDVVQFIDPLNPQRLLIKRIIGLPGERVVFENNGVVIRDEQDQDLILDEWYLAEGMYTRSVSGGAFISDKIPPNSFFVLGDNRIASRDSREIGPINRRYINGEVIPLSSGKK